MGRDGNRGNVAHVIPHAHNLTLCALEGPIGTKMENVRKAISSVDHSIARLAEVNLRFV